MINAMDRLIIILLLEDETISNRDEAAMDLSEYDDPLAERALIQGAANPNTDAMTAYSCGFSLAEIWVRQDRFPVEITRAFGKDALFGIKEGIGGKPEWLPLLNSRAA
jgi:hypothetical protein